MRTKDANQTHPYISKHLVCAKINKIPWQLINHQCGFLMILWTNAHYVNRTLIYLEGNIIAVIVEGMVNISFMIILIV